MLVLAVLLAQADPTQLSSPSTWTQFGPFAIVFVVMTTLGGGIILWLLRDRAKTATAHEAQLAAQKASHDKDLAAAKADYDADVKAHREQLDLERRENRALADRLVASAERTAPVLERAAQAIELTVRMAAK